MTREKLLEKTANPPDDMNERTKKAQHGVRTRARKTLRKARVPQDMWPQWLVPQAPAPRKSRGQATEHEAVCGRGHATVQPGGHPAGHEGGHIVGKIMAGMFLPLALWGAVGGSMRLYAALEPSWGATALGACGVALAMEACGTHYAKQAWQARAWVPVLLCAAVLVGAGSLDYLAGTLGPQMVAKQAQGKLMEQQQHRLAKQSAQAVQQPVQPAVAARVTATDSAQPSRAALRTAAKQADAAKAAADVQGKALDIDAKREAASQSVYQDQLANTKPIAGEGLLTTVTTLGGSVCGVLAALLLEELLAPRRRAVAPIRQAPPARSKPAGGQLALAGGGVLEAPAARESIAERWARWPLLRAVFGRRQPARGTA